MVNFFGKIKRNDPPREAIVKRPPSSGDYCFTLTGINVTKIENEYSVFRPKTPRRSTGPATPHELIPSYRSFDVIGNRMATSSLEKIGIADLHIEPLATVLHHDKILSFATMTDYVLNSKLPLQTNIPCNCCHRIFNTCPIGIPIKRMGDRFVTDGVYCSFNCAVKTIEDDRDPLHTNSAALINQLYAALLGKLPNRIIKSPGWRARKLYGGWLTDDEFVKSLQILEFTDINQLSYIMRPASRIYEIREINI